MIVKIGFAFTVKKKEYNTDLRTERVSTHKEPSKFLVVL